MRSECLEELVAHRYDIVDGRLYRNDFTNRRRDSTPKPSDGIIMGGYRVVKLMIDGKLRTVRANRIVAFKTYGRIGPENEVNHKNGNKLDNHPENLEITTPSENVQHGYDVLKRDRYKNRAYGSRLNKSQIKEEDIPMIHEAHAAGETQTSIAKRYGVSQVSIHCILKGKTWSQA